MNSSASQGLMGLSMDGPPSESLIGSVSAGSVASEVGEQEATTVGLFNTTSGVLSRH